MGVTSCMLSWPTQIQCFPIIMIVLFQQHHHPEDERVGLQNYDYKDRI